eukprot:m.215557 g.215557  ORF g.215557 m.215557 type:complete len:673 (-) comp18640_c0_seq2:1059-3077(-)
MADAQTNGRRNSAFGMLGGVPSHVQDPDAELQPLLRRSRPVSSVSSTLPAPGNRHHHGALSDVTSTTMPPRTSVLHEECCAQWELMDTGDSLHRRRQAHLITAQTINADTPDECSRSSGALLLRVARICFFVASWSLFALTTTIQSDFKLLLALTDESMNQDLLDSLQLITLACTSIGALVGGVSIDAKGWYPVIATSLTLIAIGSCWTAVAFATIHRPSQMFAHLASSRAFIGWGTGAMYPAAAVLTLRSHPPHELKSKTIALTFFMQVLAAFTGVLLSTAVLVTIDDQEDAELSAGQLRVHATVMTGLAVAATAMAGIVVHKTKQQHGGTFRAADPAGSDRSLTALWEVLCKHRMQLAGAALPWLVFDVFFYGQSTFVSLLSWNSPSQDHPLRAESHSLLMCLAAIPGYVAAVALVSKLNRCLVQLAGFTILAVLFAISGIHLALADDQHIGELVIMILVYCILNAGPNTTTFIVATDSAPRIAAGSFVGLAAGVGKVGASVGYAAFKYTDVSRTAWTAKTHGVASVLSALGAVITYLFVIRSRPPTDNPQSPNGHAPPHPAETLHIADGLANSDFFIPFESLKRFDRIAAGAQGQVFLGKFGNQPVVLKEIFDALVGGDLTGFQQEATTWVKLQHPGVVRFFGVSVDGSQRYQPSFYLGLTRNNTKTNV